MYTRETIPTIEIVNLPRASKSFLVPLCNTPILPFLGSPYCSGDHDLLSDTTD